VTQKNQLKAGLLRAVNFKYFCKNARADIFIVATGFAAN
jgi:hypothetical protein